MGCFNQKRTRGGQLDRNLIRELLTSGVYRSGFVAGSLPDLHIGPKNPDNVVLLIYRSERH